MMDRRGSDILRAGGFVVALPFRLGLAMLCVLVDVLAVCLACGVAAVVRTVGREEGWCSRRTNAESEASNDR